MTTDSDAPGGKRPHAILNLKAERLDEEATAGVASAPEHTAAPATAIAPPDDKPAEQRTRPEIGWFPPFRSVATHVAAGLAGGLLALLLATAFEGGAQRASDAKSAAMERRLAEVEQWTSALPADAAALSGALPKLAAIDPLADRLGQLERDLKAMSQTLPSEEERAAERTRLGKLEERFETLAATAKSDPKAGPTAQVAGLTGRLDAAEAGLARLRKETGEQIEARVRPLEAARSGAGERDAEIDTLKSGLAAVDRSVEARQADLKALGETVGALKATIESAGKELAATARRADVAADIARLEQRVQASDAAEAQRRESVQRIVLSLELAKLKRAIDSNRPYDEELAAVRKAGGGMLDLKALEDYRGKRLPSLADLETDFRAAAHAMIDAGDEGEDTSLTGRLLGGARSFVRIRKIDYPPGDVSVAAVVTRMEAALHLGDLDAVMKETATLAPPARAAGKKWLDGVAARAAVDRALAQLETSIGATLPEKR